MNTFLKQVLANLKMNLRNKQALFWRLVFPLIFITIFGLFNLDSFASSKMVVIDRADNDISHKIVDAFKKIDFLKIENQSDLDSAKAKLKQNEIDFVIVMPESIKNLNTNFAPTITFDPVTRQPKVEMPKAPEPITMDVYYNESNVQANQLVLNVLNQITTQINAVAAGAPKLFELNSQALTNKKIRYIDFLMPGVIAMAIMQSAIMGMAVFLTEFREKKILKRVLATPVNRVSFVAAQVSAWLVVSALQTMVIISAGKLMYHINVYGRYGYIALWVLLGNLVFINIGFIIASFSKTASAAEGLAQVIAMPMMFLSGVFFSTETLPKLVRLAVEKLPLAPLINALRKIVLNGDALAATKTQFIVVGIWLVVTFIVAATRFRFIRD